MYSWYTKYICDLFRIQPAPGSELRVRNGTDVNVMTADIRHSTLSSLRNQDELDGGRAEVPRKPTR
jgi:hypothetical protein